MDRNSTHPGNSEKLLLQGARPQPWLHTLYGRFLMLIPKNFKLPHSVIVKAPGLLPMLYKPSEIAKDLGIPDRTLRDWLDKFGAPHQRDQQDHLWIHGAEFAQWVHQVRLQKKACRLEPNQAYCLRCNQAVEFINPQPVKTIGRIKLLRSTCPHCGGVVHRGGKYEHA